MYKKVGRPKKFDSRDIVVTVRLSRQEYTRLRMLADKKKTSISDVIRLLISKCWTLIS